MKTDHRRQLWVAVFVVVAALCVGLRTHRSSVLFADLLPLHLGSRCLVLGCDAYKAADLNALAPQGRPILAEAPVYPPSALMVVAPLEPLPDAVAGWVFAGLSALAAAFAVAGMLRRTQAAPVLVGLGALAISPALTDVLQFGNPALLAVSLAAIAVLMPGAWPLLGIAVALKPQLGLGVAVWMLLRGETRAAGVKALGVAAVLLVVGIAAAAHASGGVGFIGEIAANLRLAGMPGHSMDASGLNDEAYSFLNLQPLLSRVHLPLMLAVLGSMMMLLFVRRARPYTALALLVVAGLLPLYHREYDRVAVLLLLPALMEMGRLRWVFAALVVGWMASDLVLGHSRFAFWPVTGLLTFLLGGWVVWERVLPDGPAARGAVTS